jgi:hypothetical protein
MRVSIPPKRYASHIALVYFFHEPSYCFEEGRCDTLMEDDDDINSRISIDGIIIE